MNRPDQFDWTLLDRVAAGDATPDEAARVERWLAADPARRALLDAMRHAEGGRNWDVAAAWSSVRSRALRPDTAVPDHAAPSGIAAPQATVPSGVAAPKASAPSGSAAPQASTPSGSAASSAAARAAHRWGRPALLRAAAVVAVVGGAALAGRVLLDRESGGAAELVTAATTRSQSDTLQLDDGSLVILAPESRLEYPRRFGAAAREVRLTGEAFFRVAADAARPFTISAGNAEVRVVGTEFVVRAADASAVTVAVAEGVVRVRAAGEAEEAFVVVQQGQVARVAADGETTVEPAADLDPFMAWLEGRLVFEDAPLGEVLEELRRWYPFEFRADEALLERRVTARLRAGSLEETVAALALALGAAHGRANDTIVFTITHNPR